MEINQHVINLFQYDFNSFDQNNMILLKSIDNWNKRNEFNLVNKLALDQYLIQDAVAYNRFIGKLGQTYPETFNKYFVSIRLSNQKISSLYLPFEEGLIIA